MSRDPNIPITAEEIRTLIKVKVKDKKPEFVTNSVLYEILKKFIEYIESNQSTTPAPDSGNDTGGDVDEGVSGDVRFSSDLPIFQVVHEPTSTVVQEILTSEVVYTVQNEVSSRFFCRVGTNANMRARVWVNRDYTKTYDVFSVPSPYPADCFLQIADYVLFFDNFYGWSDVSEDTQGYIIINGTITSKDQSLYIGAGSLIPASRVNDSTIQNTYNFPVSCHLSISNTQTGAVDFTLEPNETKTFPLASFEGITDPGFNSPGRVLTLTITKVST